MTSPGTLSAGVEEVEEPVAGSMTVLGSVKLAVEDNIEPSEAQMSFTATRELASGNLEIDAKVCDNASAFLPARSSIQVSNRLVREQSVSPVVLGTC